MSTEPDPKPDLTSEASETESDAPTTEDAPQRELTPEEQLAQAAQKQQEYLNLAHRAQADLENYRKRVNREREEEKRFANQGLVTELLTVLDNLNLALESAKQSGESGPLVSGVAMVESLFRDVLRRYNVERMEDLIGQEFDPALHQALLRQPTADYPPHTIVAVLKHGYRLHDRVLRPADVAVAAPPVETTSGNEESDNSKNEGE